MRKKRHSPPGRQKPPPFPAGQAKAPLPLPGGQKLRSLCRAGKTSAIPQRSGKSSAFRSAGQKKRPAIPCRSLTLLFFTRVCILLHDSILPHLPLTCQGVFQKIFEIFCPPGRRTPPRHRKRFTGMAGSRRRHGGESLRLSTAGIPFPFEAAQRQKTTCRHGAGFMTASAAGRRQPSAP